jgi:BMFP domain-containing protein YqiC
MSKKIFDDVADKISKVLPSGFKQQKDDVDSKIKDILKIAFDKLDLVTREEFDIQKKILLKTRKQLDDLSSKIDKNTHKDLKKDNKK